MIDGTDTVYQNDNYTVFVRVADVPIEIDLVDYDQYYEAINRTTGVAELRHVCLPVMLYNIERWNLDLTNESYKWRAEEDDEVDLFGIDDEEPEPTVN
jgi:hypothetical protein